MPLSDTAIRNAKPSNKSYKMPDERGMYLFVMQTGGKSFRLDYRHIGKRFTLTLGTYPDVSLAKAREARDSARKLLADGINPSEERKALKASKEGSAANSFEVIAREWVSTYMKDRSESHTGRILRRFELYLFPWIGKKAIIEITAPEILTSIKRVQDQNKLETAHRTLQACGQVFRYAVQTGRAGRDVTADLKGALPSPTVKHMAAFTEPSDVAELLGLHRHVNCSISNQTSSVSICSP